MSNAMQTFTENQLSEVAAAAIQRALVARVGAGRSIDLPSGMTVIIRPVDQSTLIVEGVIPSELVTEAISGFPSLARMDAGDTSLSQGELGKLIEGAARLRAALVTRAAVAPRISISEPTDASAGVLNYSDLDPADGDYILSLLYQGVEQWRGFRETTVRHSSVVERVSGTESEAISDGGGES